MIRYYVQFQSSRTRRWTTRYFDPWQPDEDLLWEDVRSSAEPEIFDGPCRVSPDNISLYERVMPLVTTDMQVSATHVIFENMPLCIFEDMCRDAGFEDGIDFRLVALFVFWHKYKIPWPSRVFEPR